MRRVRVIMPDKEGLSLTNIDRTFIKIGQGSYCII